MARMTTAPANTAALTVLTDARNVKALDVLKTAGKWTKATVTIGGEPKVVYLIPGTGKAPYTVNQNACNCPDFTYRYRAIQEKEGKVSKHLACKHMLAVRCYLMMGHAWLANQPKES